jgi:hypothetical protein
MKTFLMGALTFVFAIVVVLFLGSCGATLQQRLDTQRLARATICATAEAACEPDILPESDLRTFACAVVLAACLSETLPDIEDTNIETESGSLYGRLPGVFRCRPGEDCRLSNQTAEWWNGQFRELFGDDMPDVALVGPSGWITIAEDDLPPHGKGSDADRCNGADGNECLMRSPTLLGWTSYGYIRGLGIIDSANITLQRGEWRDVDMYHEGGHALFGFRNRLPSVSERNIMSTPPHNGWGLTRSDGFAVLVNCILRN